MFWAQFLFLRCRFRDAQYMNSHLMKLYHSRVGSEGGGVALALLILRCPSGSVAKFLVFAWNRNPAFALALCNMCSFFLL